MTHLFILKTSNCILITFPARNSEVKHDIANLRDGFMSRRKYYCMLAESEGLLVVITKPKRFYGKLSFNSTKQLLCTTRHIIYKIHYSNITSDKCYV